MPGGRSGLFNNRTMGEKVMITRTMSDDFGEPLNSDYFSPL